MLADALVVLGLRQNLVVLAIRQYEYRTLDAAHKLLDDHLCRSVAEHTAQHLLQLLLSLVEGGQNQYALAGTKSVGFQHVGSFQCLKEG